MRIQPTDLSNLAQAYQQIITEAHDETGSVVPSPDTVEVLSEHDKEQIKTQIDYLIGDLGEGRDDAPSVEMDALKYIMEYAQERLQDLGHLE